MKQNRQLEGALESRAAARCLLIKRNCDRQGQKVRIRDPTRHTSMSTSGFYRTIVTEPLNAEDLRGNGWRVLNNGAVGTIHSFRDRPARLAVTADVSYVATVGTELGRYIRPTKITSWHYPERV